MEERLRGQLADVRALEERRGHAIADGTDPLPQLVAARLAAEQLRGRSGASEAENMPAAAGGDQGAWRQECSLSCSQTPDAHQTLRALHTA